MIEYKTGNIFDSPCKVLTCPVNCVGTMGKGLALDFKQRFDGLDSYYQEALRTGALHINKPCIVPPARFDEKFICLFPTKWHWREPSRAEWIWQGFSGMTMALSSMGLYDLGIAFPKLGCGLGGLSWDNEVRPMFLDYFGDEPERLIEIYV